MSDRQSPEMTESIAEALRAGLALMTVVLLARANAGALAKGPSIWLGVSVSLVVWGAAAGAARWSRYSGGSRLAMWRDCVAPALVTLLLAGRSGGSGALAMGVAIVAIGSMAVGLAATCGLGRPSATDNCQVDSSAEEAEPDLTCSRSLSSDGTDRNVCSTGEVEQTGMPASLDQTICEAAQERKGDAGPTRSECTLLDNPASVPIAATPPAEARPADLAEIVETSVDDSPPVESWTRMESDGEVSIEAVVLARFTEGTKLAVVHLPFVPPLATVPQIECEPLDSGCEVTIKTEAAYRHGARLSVTRQSAGPAESVPIGVVVYTSAE